jgi:hypothetical protein
MRIRKPVKKAAALQKKARLELEAKSGKKVVTRESFLPPALKKRLAKKTAMGLRKNKKRTLFSNRCQRLFFCSLALV